eukprot:CAMPEP_0177600864 /NCGR_PEP_ID=MMETSP0419_2-20121207/13907_1 /TAXON_ID=582737 /ORGANISM="Tetraselmis sp., Strain GSL018" /LENGTH=190 /DNA_ID=CAMNT_0019093999 /DNA_START=366 /DNA_END=935 /DNA_ORIENTATION=-
MDAGSKGVQQLRHAQAPSPHKRPQKVVCALPPSGGRTGFARGESGTAPTSGPGSRQRSPPAQGPEARDVPPLMPPPLRARRGPVWAVAAAQGGPPQDRRLCGGALRRMDMTVPRRWRRMPPPLLVLDHVLSRSAGPVWAVAAAQGGPPQDRRLCGGALRRMDMTVPRRWRRMPPPLLVLDHVLSRSAGPV